MRSVEPGICIRGSGPSDHPGMTVFGNRNAHQDAAPLRRRHQSHRRRQQVAGPHQRRLLGFCRSFGGTAATMLRALIDHPEASGDPLSMTVNYLRADGEGPFDLDVRLVKANRSSQHWWVEMSQDGADDATFATAVFAERVPRGRIRMRISPRDAVRGDAALPACAPWVRQYDFRFVEGQPKFAARPAPPDSATPGCGSVTGCRARSNALSLMSMSDAFFGRIFHVRNGNWCRSARCRSRPISIPTQRTLPRRTSPMSSAVANASTFHRSYCDQNGQLRSPTRLLATTTQIAYFKRKARLQADSNHSSGRRLSVAPYDAIHDRQKPRIALLGGRRHGASQARHADGTGGVAHCRHRADAGRTRILASRTR